MRMQFASLVASTLGIVLLASCVERKEHLSISPEGRVWWEVTHDTDSLPDLLDGDAVPRVEGGWAAEREEKQDEEGKVSYRLHAVAAFGPKHKLPSNFALPSETDGDLYLQFPTTVTFERRRGETLCHFHRAYLARPWAAVQQLRERLVDSQIADLKDIEFDQWTPQQRQTVVRAMVNFEVHKLLLLAREAYLDAASDKPQDGWLAIRNEMLGCASLVDVAAIAQMLEPVESEVEQQAIDAMVQAETENFATALREKLIQSAKDLAGFDGSKTNQFMAAYDRLVRLYEITEDLGDERITITVTMPGPVFASNAESTAGNTVTWTVDGQMMRDQDVELMATSAVAR